MSSIVGYTYRADNWHGSCLILAMIERGTAAPAARDMHPENVLDQIAGANGIDRDDEWTFDTDDFPKVILSIDAEPDERCGGCGAVLR